MKRFIVLFVLLCMAVVSINTEVVFSAEEKNEMTQEELAGEIAKYPGFGLDEKLSFPEVCTELTNKGIVLEGGWDKDNPKKLVPEEEIRRLLKIAIFGTIKELIPEEKIVLIKMDGKVWKKGEGKNEWGLCKLREEFNLGDSIKTEGNAILGWGKIAVIKAPQSEFIIEDYKKLFLKSGSVYVDAEKKSELKVITPTTVAAVRGTIYVVSVGEGSKDLVRGRTE